MTRISNLPTAVAMLFLMSSSSRIMSSSLAIPPAEAEAASGSRGISSLCRRSISWEAQTETTHGPAAVTPSDSSPTRMAAQYWTSTSGPPAPTSHSIRAEL